MLARLRHPLVARRRVDPDEAGRDRGRSGGQVNRRRRIALDRGLFSSTTAAASSATSAAMAASSDGIATMRSTVSAERSAMKAV